MAIAFLNSYANPANEARARELICGFTSQVEAERLPFVSISSDASREWREYERTSTCVLNAYVMPLVDKHLRKLTCEFRRLGMQGTLYMMLRGPAWLRSTTQPSFPSRRWSRAHREKPHHLRRIRFFDGHH